MALMSSGVSVRRQRNKRVRHNRLVRMRSDALCSKRVRHRPLHISVTRKTVLLCVRTKRACRTRLFPCLCTTYISRELSSFFELHLVQFGERRAFFHLTAARAYTYHLFPPAALRRFCLRRHCGLCFFQLGFPSELKRFTRALRLSLLALL